MKKFAILLTFGDDSLRGASYFSVYGGGGSSGTTVIVEWVSLAKGFNCRLGMSVSVQSSNLK